MGYFLQLVILFYMALLLGFALPSAHVLLRFLAVGIWWFQSRCLIVFIICINRSEFTGLLPFEKLKLPLLLFLQYSLQTSPWVLYLKSSQRLLFSIVLVIECLPAHSALCRHAVNYIVSAHNEKVFNDSLVDSELLHCLMWDIIHIKKYFLK